MIVARGGDDTIFGRGGDDAIIADASGTLGNDRLYGEAGDDTLSRHGRHRHLRRRAAAATP